MVGVGAAVAATLQVIEYLYQALHLSGYGSAVHVLSVRLVDNYKPQPGICSSAGWAGVWLSKIIQAI